MTVTAELTKQIGRSLPRPGAEKLARGRGTYVDDIVLPRLTHIAVLRSPHAHAGILAVDMAAARRAPGVVAAVTGAELAQHYKPWLGTLSHQPALRSVPQHALAVDRARWQGEPVAAVVAETRAQAEDAVELIRVDWEELPAVADPELGLAPESEIIHPSLGSNLAFQRELAVGDVDAAFAAAHLVVAESFRFGRHTGLPLEPRGMLAAFDPSERRLTAWHSGQCPHMMQALLSRVVGLPEWQIRVICREVGGSFGMKIHVYGDEIAAVVMAMRLGRPVKFVADRLESFVSDVHARDHVVTARMAVDAEGIITGLEVDDLTGIGPFSCYPRGSVTEANMVVGLTGAQYPIANYRARTRIVFQNKNMMSQCRAVGHPIAMAVGEHLAEKAAKGLGLDSFELRRRNLAPDDSYPRTAAGGAKFERLSHHACLARLHGLMDYDRLRGEQASLRHRGIHRGIGIAVFVEGTGAGTTMYGPGGAPISAQDGVTVRLDPSGSVACAAGVTEQGQGTEAILAQIVADAVGLPPEQVRVVTGDTDAMPYGGGTWGSRGAPTGGAAAWLAGRALRDNILDIAGVLLQSDAAALDISDGDVVDAATGVARMTLRELATIAYFRCNELPDDVQAEFVATRHYRLTGYTHFFANGIHGAHVELDPETGVIRLLKYWVVDDCGRVINPMLVDGQVRGGAVQGIGAALFEHCVYDGKAQLRNGTLADYLVPMAAEMPDIVCSHIETPTRLSPLGAKGVGEAGVVAAQAVLLNAVNDALAPFGASVAETPITPRVVLRALGRIASR